MRWVIQFNAMKVEMEKSLKINKKKEQSQFNWNIHFDKSQSEINRHTDSIPIGNQTSSLVIGQRIDQSKPSKKTRSTKNILRNTILNKEILIDILMITQFTSKTSMETLSNQFQLEIGRARWWLASASANQNAVKPQWHLVSMKCQAKSTATRTRFFS